MICKKCGFDCKDGMVFCPNCGTELKNEPEDAVEPTPAEDPDRTELITENAPPQPQYSDPQQPRQQYPDPQSRQQYVNPQQPYAPMYGQPAYPYGQAPQAGYAPYSSGAYAAPNAGSAVHRALKEVGASPVVLIAAILLAAAVLLGIVSQVARSVNINNALGDIYGGFGGLDNFGDFDEFEDFIDDFNDLGLMFSADPSVSAASAIFSAIPNIIIVIGVFVVFASAKSRTSPTLGTGGLTLINVINGITLGAICFIVFLILIVFGAAAVSLSAAGDVEYLAVGMAIIFIVLALIVGVVLSYYICLVRAVGAVKKTARTGVPEVRGSVMYVAVLDFIIGAFTVFGSFSLIANAIAGNAVSLIGALADICSGTAIIMFGVALVSYRSRMKSVAAAAPAAAYGQPPLTVCPRCGAQYPASLPACPRCGMPKNMYR